MVKQLTKKSEESKRIRSIDIFLTINLCNVYFNKKKMTSDDYLINSFEWDFKQIDDLAKERYYMYLYLIMPLNVEENETLKNIRMSFIDEMYNIYKINASMELMLECIKFYYEQYLAEKQLMLSTKTVGSEQESIDNVTNMLNKYYPEALVNAKNPNGKVLLKRKENN